MNERFICIKCGEDNASKQWQSDVDMIRCACVTCGFSWTTFPMDASQTRLQKSIESQHRSPPKIDKATGAFVAQPL